MTGETQFRTELLIAGETRTDVAKLAGGTYYRGNPLVYDAGQYKYSATVEAEDATAIFLGDGVSDSTTIPLNGGLASILIWGDVFEAGIVNNSGAQLTITENMRVAFRQNGFFVKRK